MSVSSPLANRFVALVDGSPSGSKLSQSNTIATGSTQSPSYVVISGGTGANSIISAFGPSAAFVLPVSDDGGSSAEILRCFGGPSIGDIRSRLIRLIPLPESPVTAEDKERAAIYHLMAYRFPAEAAEKEVREIWLEIVEGRSDLWHGIGEDKKECIRAFLVHFQTLCLRRAHKRFSFRNFSLGNGFLTGARDLFGSLPSAVFLFKAISGVNHGAQVIPAINTNQTVTIAAQLANSTTLVGQCAISHPTSSTSSTAPVPTSSATSPTLPNGLESINETSAVISRSSSLNFGSQKRSHLRSGRKDSRTFDTDLHSSLREDLSRGNISYRKGEVETPLEARIERIFYINLYGQEIFPEPNSEYIETLSQRDILVYSCGSLWTSIAPCLNLRGLATAIARSPSLKAKVILLNSINDRETPDYTASVYVNSLLDTFRHLDQERQYDVNRLISHVVYLEGCQVEIDPQNLESLGIKFVKIPQRIHGTRETETPMFTAESVEWAMTQITNDVLQQ